MTSDFAAVADFISSEKAEEIRARYHRANARSDELFGVLRTSWVGGYNLGYASAIGDVMDLLGIPIDRPLCGNDDLSQVPYSEGGADWSDQEVAQIRSSCLGNNGLSSHKQRDE